MSEKEAAKRLCALINEIQAAGYQVVVGDAGTDLWVGDHVIQEPQFDDGEWSLYR